VDADTLLPYDEARIQFTREYLRRLLTLTRGNVSRAARLAGRNRTDLYKLLRRTGVSLAEFKGTLQAGGQAGP
jgi:two-component system response regulator GlrR